MGGGSGTDANRVFLFFHFHLSLMISAVDPIISVFRIDKLDVSEGEMADLLF